MSLGAVISGIGMSRIGRRTGIPGAELTLEAARAALSDAGIGPADLDGIATMGDTPPETTAASLGIEPPDKGRGFDSGGLLSPLMSACLAVEAGQAHHVLVYRTVEMIGGSLLEGPGAGRGRAASRSAPAPARVENPLAAAMGDMGPLITYHAYSAANWLALHCQRHMHLYGTTKEQLGWVAIESRRHAALNPAAVYRDPITMDDYLGARPISSPFGLLDCDVPVDGSIALVVSVPEHAGNCPNPAIGVEAIGGAPGTGGWLHRADYPRMAASDAAAQMWAATDLSPVDVDVAELYDGFSFLALAWLEALGLCSEGGSGEFVEGGSRIGLDGELPLNTYGGQLSAGRMHGYWVLHEACLQLRGQAGNRQVPGGPEVAVASAGGGPIAGCMLLTRYR